LQIVRRKNVVLKWESTPGCAAAAGTIVASAAKLLQYRPLIESAYEPPHIVTLPLQYGCVGKPFDNVVAVAAFRSRMARIRRRISASA